MKYLVIILLLISSACAKPPSSDTPAQVCTAAPSDPKWLVLMLGNGANAFDITACGSCEYATHGSTTYINCGG